MANVFKPVFGQVKTLPRGFNYMFPLPSREDPNKIIWIRGRSVRREIDQIWVGDGWVPIEYYNKRQTYFNQRWLRGRLDGKPLG